MRIPTFSLIALSDREKEEAISDFNRWVTGEAVGHDPTVEECYEHYFRNKPFVGKTLLELLSSGVAIEEVIPLETGQTPVIAAS